jgi:hypothetical protein
MVRAARPGDFVLCDGMRETPVLSGCLSLIAGRQPKVLSSLVEIDMINAQ